MPVYVIGTLKPKNNGKFPVAEAVDIKVTDDLRLDEALENKADLSTVNFALGGKADNSDIDSLQEQINQIITPVTQEAEVQNARVDTNGVTHDTLKSRLDYENSNITDNLDTLNQAFITNLFNINSDLNTEDYYLGSNGVPISNEYNLCYSHIITVKPNTKYTFLRYDNYFGDVSQYAYGYKNGTFSQIIEGTKSTINGSTVSTITVPADITQIRINYRKNTPVMVVEGESYPSTFLTYGKIYQSDNLVIINSVQSEINSENITDIKSKIVVYDKTIKSWADINSYTNNYIDGNGIKRSSQYLKLSEFLQVKSGDTVSVSGMRLDIGGSTIYGVSCYDENKNIILNEGITGSTNNVSGSFVVSADTKYIAISELVTTYSHFDIKVYTENIGEKTSDLIEDMNNVPLKKFVGRKIVNFGDSIFGQARPRQDISSFIAESTGATVYNCGFGGCRMGQHSSEIYDAFSMYRLAYSIAENDWTLQDTALEDTSLPSYFADTISLMKSLDWSEIDICTIAYGTNDFADGLRPYRNDYGKTDMRTYSDALRYSIETLLNAFPNIRIFVITPHYRFWLNSGEFVDDSNTHEVESWVDSQNYKLTDYVQSGKDVAKEYQIPVIDDYYDLGFNKFNRSVYYPSSDGTHQNATGRKMIAEHISHCLY